MSIVRIARTLFDLVRVGLFRRRYRYIQPIRRADEIERLGCPARFSIVVPVYNAKPVWLGGVVSSVTAQWYPHWELILVDDASPSTETRSYLDGIRDERIIVQRLEHNSGISDATNAALEIAGGDYVVFLDHDDELTPDCLFELAKRIKLDDPDFIYSDEDKLDERGHRVEPFFKPDWSPDTLMSTMYTCHVMCVRRSLLAKTGLMRGEYNGAQDWDLVLRIAEQTKRIAHIPKVLYHWRSVPQSTSSDLAAKPYAVEAGLRAREAALERRGLRGTFSPLEGVFGFFSLKYDCPPDTRVSVIVHRREARQDVGACIASVVRNSGGLQLEFVIVDSSSQPDGDFDRDEFIDGRYIRVTRTARDEPLASVLNRGAEAATGDVLMFLSADLRLRSADGLARMAGYASLPHVAAVGAKIVSSRLHRILHAGIVIGPHRPRRAFLLQGRLYKGHYLRNRLEFNWSAVSADALMISLTKFNALAGFEPEMMQLAGVDLCSRAIAAGLFNVVCPDAEFDHTNWLGALRAIDLEESCDMPEGEGSTFQANDPFYNVNFQQNASFIQNLDRSTCINDDGP